MKRRYCLLVISLLFIISCSTKEEALTNKEKDILVKKITSSAIYKTGEKGFNNSFDFTYSKNNLVSASSLIGDYFTKTVFTYTENIISKAEYYDSKNLMISSTIYTYSEGKLITVTKQDVDSTVKQIKNYIYNSDGTVEFTETTNAISTNLITKKNTGKLTYFNGNLIKKEIIDESTPNITDVTSYSYDIKYNPFKNIVGLDKLLDNTAYVLPDIASINNAIKITITSISDGNILSNYTLSGGTFIYDKNNFISKLIMDENDLISTTEYEY